MKVRKWLALMLAIAGSVTGMLGAGQHALADAGTHVFYVNGISTIVPGSQCQYVWKNLGGNPVRDELGIPQPSTQPPTCRKDGVGNPIACHLARNLGPYPPSWRTADPTQGEVGLNPPCAGVLTADLLPGEEGCIDVEADTNTSCKLNAPTWFYGFCAQTYGGDTQTDGVGSNATITINGNLWKFEKLGFARGRGAWEFGAKLYKNATPADKTTAHFYLDAIPNPNEAANAAGCDGGPAVKSVEFFGTITIPAPPVKAIRTKPFWHPCADDPGFNVPLIINGTKISDATSPVPGYVPDGC